MSTVTHEPGGRAVSNRTVLIVFGGVIVALTVTFALAGAGWVALVVPAALLVLAAATIYSQIVYQRIIFPAVAVLVLGVVRSVRLVSGKKKSCQQDAAPTNRRAGQLPTSPEGPSSDSERPPTSGGCG
jgi:hypothetical protein